MKIEREQINLQKLLSNQWKMLSKLYSNITKKLLFSTEWIF